MTLLPQPLQRLLGIGGTTSRVRRAQPGDEPVQAIGVGVTELLGEHHPTGVEVGSGGGAVAPEQLRSEVALRPDHAAGRGQAGRLGGQCDPEVGEQDPAGAVHDDVARLDVTMDDPSAVDMPERLEQRPGERLGLGRLIALAELGEAGAVDVLADEIGAVALGAVVIDRDEVRMGERGRGAGLPLEALREGRVPQ